MLGLWTLFLAALLLGPVGQAPIKGAGGFAHWDKVAHFGLFAVTGFAGIFGSAFLPTFRRRVLFGAVFGLALAAGTEWAQSMTVSRQSSWPDLVADLMGLAAAVALYAVLYRQTAVRSWLRL